MRFARSLLVALCAVRFLPQVVSCLILAAVIATGSHAQFGGGTIVQPVGLAQNTVAISSDGRIGEIVREVFQDGFGGKRFRLLFREREGTGTPSTWQEVAVENFFTNDLQLNNGCLWYDSDDNPTVLYLGWQIGGTQAFWRQVVRTNGVWTTMREFPAGGVTQASFAIAPDGTVDIVTMYADVFWASVVSIGHGTLDADGLSGSEIGFGAQPTVLRAFEAPQAGQLGWIYTDYPRHLSLARDASGGLHLVYSVDQYINEISGGTQVYSSLFYRSRPAGGAWSEAEEILYISNGWGDAGLGASIAVAPNGTIAVASALLPRAPTGSPGVCQLRYLVKTPTGWSSSTVASSSAGYVSSDGERGTGLEPHLIFDELSRPRILFSDHASKHWPSIGAQSYSGQVRLATRASATSGAWTFSTLLNRGSTAAHNFQNYRSAHVTRGGLSMVVTTSWKFVQGNPYVYTYVALPSGQMQPAPTIASVTPAAGPTAGGTTITIAGTDLAGATVKVGGVAATNVVATATSVTCATPPGTLGAKDVVVSTLGGDVVRAGGFTYMGSPTIATVTPSSGPAAGGTAISITGTNLAGATVKIGTSNATSVVASSTSITCISPAGSAGAKDVLVTAPGGVATKTAGFTYLPTPTIAGVTPSVGPLAGGTTVTITGTNLAGASVTIGGLSASVVSATSTSVTCTTPAATAGSKDVVVTNANGTATRANGFSYVGAPSIASVTPSAGPLAGGTTITIAGSFLAGATVKVGGVNATNVVATASSITCTTPAGTAGAKDVLVTTAGGLATAIDAFTHVPAPTIISVTPSSGPAAIGTAITITGTNLVGATVKIGTLQATNVVASPTSITCTTPVSTVGAKNVVVTTPGGSATRVNGFSYTNAWYVVLEQSPDPSVVTSGSLRSAISATGRPWRVRDIATGIEMVLIPPGTYNRGCSPSVESDCDTKDEFPIRAVTLTNAFYIGRYEVTQGQWLAKM
ncbi:MAG: IPT/TIG domain-containing protein, partial [bacterium]